MSSLKYLLAKVLDLVVAVVASVSLPVLRIPARANWTRFPLTRGVSNALGVLPVAYHYYEPIFRSVNEPPIEAQKLDIDLSVDPELICGLEKYVPEITYTNQRNSDWNSRPQFYFGNEFFEHGDAEVLYALIRAKKPRRII